MALQAPNSTSIGIEPPAAAAVSTCALDGLAARCRPLGLHLLMFRADGSLAFADAAAAPFFARYAMPLVVADRQIGDRVRALTAAATASPLIHDRIPGVAIALVPYVERRQVAGALALAARADGGLATEDVMRACNQLALDATWLARQADALAAWDAAALRQQVPLALAMLRDQQRLAGMEQELHSLSEQLANTYEELSLIYQLSGGMRVNRRPADFFRQACLEALEVLNVRGMGVALRGEGIRWTEPALYGHADVPAPRVRRLADQLLPLLRDRKGPLLINDVAADANLAWLADDVHQLLAVPMQRQETVLGCLFVVDKRAGEFDSVDTKLLMSIANESAIYLENAMLFGDVHGLMMGLLHSLTSAVDAKDAYTCGHSERVALLGRHLAAQVGLSDPEVEQIYMAGLLHDVGKIGVPESVLQKTGRLTAEEFEQMKKHPQIGARILADVKQVKSIIPGVLHHHERYDGKGYPGGLAAGQIPLMGRIICLADCFDAMTSNRTYRKALPLEVALTEIRRCAGTQFDPALAEAFLRTHADGYRELLKDHAEKSKRLLELQETLRTV